MKVSLMLAAIVITIAVWHQPIIGVDGQSIVSPFIMLCRRTCGGFGFFRRLCCMVDSLCCSKPDSCPEDITADTLIPFCQTCNEDVDCLFRSKCCDSGDRKCCTAIRPLMLRNSFFNQRAKDKKDEDGNKTENKGKTSASNHTEEIPELIMEDHE